MPLRAITWGHSGLTRTILELLDGDIAMIDVREVGEPILDSVRVGDIAQSAQYPGSD